jgi:hypothetical protein
VRRRVTVREANEEAESPTDRTNILVVNRY